MPTSRVAPLRAILLTFGVLVCLSSTAAWGAFGQLKLTAIDEETQKPISIHLQVWNAKGRPRLIRGVPKIGEKFVVDGTIVLRLPPGNYRFLAERGLEYLDRSGSFTIRNDARDSHQILMKRFVDMRSLGWMSLDLGQVRSPRDLVPTMLSGDFKYLLGRLPTGKSLASVEPCDDCDFSFASRFSVDRQLALFEFPKPNQDEITDRSSSNHEPLSAGRILRLALDEPDRFCVGMDVAHRDLPMWIASRALDGIRVIRPPDASSTFEWAPDSLRYPGQRGGERWREHIYFQLLEAGIALTPLAASYATEQQLPAGTPRTYVYVPPLDADREKLWSLFADSIAAGRTTITAGPILAATFNGQPPGYRFEGTAEDEVSLRPALTLRTKEKISYLELIKNGEVAHQIRLDELAKAGGALPDVTFDDSGWMLVRAVIDDDDSYRMAMTAPVFVEFDETPRISRKAVSFFLEWAQQRLSDAESTPAKSPNSKPSPEVKLYRPTVEFWQLQLSKASVE